MRATNNAKPRWVMGYTTRRHLLIDLDCTSYFKVVGLVHMIIDDWPEVGDCEILLSSSPAANEEWRIYPDGNHKHLVKKHNYHMVFSNFIGYEKACHIIETLAALGVINPDYVNVRNMRQDITLRISPVVNVFATKNKPTSVLYIHNNQIEKRDNGIEIYNRFLHACH